MGVLDSTLAAASERDSVAGAAEAWPSVTVTVSQTVIQSVSVKIAWAWFARAIKAGSRRAVFATMVDDVQRSSLMLFLAAMRMAELSVVVKCLVLLILAN